MTDVVTLPASSLGADRVGLRTHRLLALLLGLAALGAGVAGNAFLPLRLVVLVFVMLGPGTALVALAPGLRRDPALAWAYRLGLSLGFLMLTSGVTNLVGGQVLARPLDGPPLLGGYAIGLVLLSLPWLVSPSRPLPVLRRQAVALRWSHLTLLLPVVAAAGAERLNGERGPLTAMAAAAACLVLVLVAAVRAGRWRLTTLALVLFSVGLALQWAYSLRSQVVLGWDVQQEFRVFTHTSSAGLWHPYAPDSSQDGDAYNSLLSITVLPTALTHLVGLPGAYVFKLLVPVVYAAVPVVAFCLAHRFASRRGAFLAAVLILARGAFSQEMPAVTRQEVGLLFFALLVATLFDQQLATWPRTWLVGALASGLVVSHYSSAYFAIFVLAAVAFVVPVLELLRRKRLAVRAVTIPAVVFLGLVGFLWNGPLTHSTSNLRQFEQTIESKGLNVLPNSEGKNALTVWLRGNAPDALSVAEYSGDVGARYRGLSWLRPYLDSQVRKYPLQASNPSPEPGLAPALLPVFDAGAVIASQLINLLAVTGTGLLLVRGARRRHPGMLEIGLLSAATVTTLALIRISGSTAGAYNQERALQQGLIVLCVPLACVLGAGSGPTVRLAGAALVGTLMLTGSGLAPVLTGGSPSVVFHDSGEDYERFFVHPQELAAARWLADHRQDPDYPVYTDRYGQLRLWQATDVKRAVVSDLAPSALAENAYVFATVGNVVDHRARGAVDQRFVTFAFPEAFLDAHKDLVFSTGDTRVYR